ncbi:MAG TPA: ABC transporter substrate-binding protein [bacterium]|nr:ABC transporter substrate-binding protein [bacterium]HOP56117.1 ABC transporter substrate-binding protein [bacterium]HRU32277.1 ABC transporter substrate-binding protein [bacterium]
MRIPKILVILALCAGILVSSIPLIFGAEKVEPGEYYNLSDYEKLTGKKITRFAESPQLAELVKQGKLPPLEQRIPKNPLVVTPYEEIGQYGGTWRRTWSGLSDSAGPYKLCSEHLVMFNKNGTKILPNVAESWKVSRDAKTYTFKLREGIRWSDGTPLTTEDVVFWYEDIILNKDLTPTIPNWLTSGGKPLKLEKIDTYTFKVEFEEPNALFLISIGKMGGGHTFFAPKHYLKQFHPKYTPKEKLDELVKKAGLQNWYQLFGNMNDFLQNPDLPVIYPWKATNLPTATLQIMERNPYYWKIDPEGNQLPYIDRITHTLLGSAGETAVLKAISGEVDMQERGLVIDNYTLLMENRTKGNYRVLRWPQGTGASPAILLNQNVKDPVLRKIFEDRRFRIALSLAINREEINQLFYLGLGEPRQASIISGAPFYDPEWEKAYAEYDPKKANEYLDKMGLTKRDKDGFRLRPDGKTLILTIEYSGDRPYMEVIKKYWEAIGVKVFLKPLERSLYVTRAQAGEIEVGVWGFDRNVAILSDPGHLLGTVVEAPWAPLYATWYNTGGRGGEEPKGDIKRIYELWDKVKSTIDEKQRDRYFKEIINLHKKNIWMIGIVGEVPQLIVAKNNFRNIPDGLLWDDNIRSPKNARPEQFFFKK